VTPQAANDQDGGEPPKPRGRRRKAAAGPGETPAAAPAAQPVSPEAPVLAREVDGSAAAADAADEGEGGPPRRGWWQRTFGG
jgi:ribonuclease E